MGAVNKRLSSFPPSQRNEVERLLKSYRRRVAQELTPVAAPYNATTTIVNLAVPADEIGINSAMHLQAMIECTNTSAGIVSFTPIIALGGTTLWTDAAPIPDVGTDVTKMMLIDCRIFWANPTTVFLAGFISISADVTIADTGSGALASVADVGTATVIQTSPIYHTITSANIQRDQAITVAMTIPNTSTCSAICKTAALWVE